MDNIDIPIEIFYEFRDYVFELTQSKLAKKKQFILFQNGLSS